MGEYRSLWDDCIAANIPIRAKVVIGDMNAPGAEAVVDIITKNGGYVRSHNRRGNFGN